MSIIDRLIYNRTSADKSALETLLEKAKAGTITPEEWSQLASPDHKGAYNYTDFNRVNEAVKYLAALLQSHGYEVLLAPMSVWVEEDIPTREKTKSYLDNVKTIREAISVLSATPDVPKDMESLTVEEANAIEKVLVDVETVIHSMTKVIPRAAQPMFFAGFAIYVSHAAEAPAIMYFPVYTADGMAVYTADGLAVQVI